MGLLLRYQDDTWDTETYPNRIFKQTNQTVDNELVASFEDVTPYTQEGTPVTGGLLANMAQAILGFIPSETTISADGLTMTQTSSAGTLVIQMSADGLTLTKTLTDNDGNVGVATTTFSSDGLSISTVVEIQ